MSTEVSIIIPMYNEQEVIAETHRRLRAVMDGAGVAYELIFISDGCRDESEAIMRRLVQGDAVTRLLCFSRNFGHQYAVSAGLAYARGKCAVIIDADLQDPPELIPAMLEKWRGGIDVVYGKRITRGKESALKRVLSLAFYRVLRLLSGVDIPGNTGDFRLIDRKVIDVLNAMPEHNRFLRGMVPWIGFKQAPIEFERADRWAGETKYPMRKMLALAMNGIFGFSSAPLSLPVWLGAFFGAGGVLLLLGLLIALLCDAAIAQGWWLAGLMLTLFGLLFFCMGLQGRYLKQMVDDGRGRPNYIVASAEGFAEDETTHPAGD